MIVAIAGQLPFGDVVLFAICMVSNEALIRV